MRTSKCYDNCGKWYCFGDQQCCEDDEEDCDEDTIDYACRFGSSDDGNKLSGPYLEESQCNENCKEPPECPTCVKEACKYLFDPPPPCEDPETDPPDCEDLPGQGGGWANCCDDLRERWRYEDEDWVLLHPCSEDFNAPPGTGTPACKVTTRDFPDNPEENEIKDFPCEIDWEFEPPDDNEACGETGGCGYSCVELECEEGDEDCDEENLESQCERDPSGNRKTLEECENKCPEKWKCTAVNECELNGDGEYETEEECVNRSVQKCGAYGACCFDGECEDGYLEQECIDEGGVYYGTSWCDEDPCGVPKWGTCCAYPYANSGPQPANTEEDAKQLAAVSARANSDALPKSTWTIGYFKDGEWFEDAALFDPATNQWTCTGYWTTGNPATCTDVEAEDDCKGPFTLFTRGNACLLDGCPDQLPLGPGACCYSTEAGWCVHLSYGGVQAGGDYETEADARLECEEEQGGGDEDPCLCGYARDGFGGFQVYYVCSGINQTGMPREANQSSEENCNFDDSTVIDWVWPEDIEQEANEKFQYTWYPYPPSECSDITEGNDCTVEKIGGDAQSVEFFPETLCDDTDCGEIGPVSACLTATEDGGYTCSEVTTFECGAEDSYPGLTCENLGYPTFRFAEPP